jgi:uncharacterized membrane protein
VLAIGCILAIASATAVHQMLRVQTVRIGDDIYYMWTYGARILAGDNPYESVLSGNMRDNRKYATYLPGFYLLSAATQALGLREYADWLKLWRHVFVACTVGVAWLIYWTCHRRDLGLLGLCGALLWLFNRWTVSELRAAQMDPLGILFLLWSLLWFDQRPKASAFLLGTSLVLKQMAVFLLPLYVVWRWQASRADRGRGVSAALAAMAAPLLLCVPFVVWNAEAFVMSIMFSATRNAISLGPLAIDSVAGLSGLAARLPMVALLLLLYLAAARYRVGMYAASLLAWTIFIDFNPVLFDQYMVWVVPFVPLAACDAASALRSPEVAARS